jgi:hypothetical protein
MPFTDLNNETKKTLKLALISINNILIENNLKLAIMSNNHSACISLESSTAGILGSIEHDGQNIYLIDEETYAEHLSTED